jgi:hypothetical protein
MHPSFAAAVVAAVLTATWLLGRRRVPLLRDVDTSAVAALNRAQIALVQAGGAGTAPANPARLIPPSARSVPRPAAPPVASAAGRAAYRAQLEAAGLRFSGMSPDGLLPENVERVDHPWFVGVQAHPELTSKPFAPHPLFRSFIEAAVKQARLV